MAWGAIASGLLGIASTIADNLFETEEEKSKATVAVLQALQTVDLQQLELNKIDAQSTDRFQSRWRPSIGWICTLAIGWEFVVAPALTWFFVATGIELPPLWTFDDKLWALVSGMLGIAGLRSFDKMKGTAG
jgi:hypothetical protein